MHAQDSCLYVQVWDGNVLRRTVGFLSIGYAGILNVDIIPLKEGEKPLKETDPVSLICDGMKTWFDLPGGFEASRIWYVEGSTLTVRAPWKHSHWVGRSRRFP